MLILMYLPLLVLDGSPVNPLQYYASQAAIIGTIMGVIIGSTQLILGIIKQRREDKFNRAKFGFQLIDNLFAEEYAVTLLVVIDHAKENATFDIKDVEKVLDAMGKPRSDRLKSIQGGIDWLLFHFDRMEFAVSAGLTNFESIRMPIGYYIRCLLPLREKFIRYNNRVGYERVDRFLNRFDCWRDTQ